MTGRNHLSGDPDQAKVDDADIRRLLAETEQRINSGDLEFVNVFAVDAIVITPTSPNIVGLEAIRAIYANPLKQSSMTVRFTTDEVVVADDLAFERGTHTLRISDKASGRVLQEVRNKHLHILKRQSDGTWKTWRMMLNSAPQTPAQLENPESEQNHIC